MKHSKWVLDGKSYRSLELINQGHCPRTGLGTLAAHIRAPHSVHVTGSSGGTSAEGNFTAMGALVGRSGFASAGREQSFEFRCVVTSGLDERCNLPKSKCMDEHELGGVHSEVATVLRFPHDGYIRGSTGPAREYTFNGQLLRVLHNGDAVHPQCCSVCVGDAPQHGVCSVFNTGGGLVDLSRSLRQHPTKHIAVGQPIFRRKTISDLICSPQREVH